MSLNLQQLVTFCTVVQEGSMTAAAEKLFLTQPAISQQIRNLEEQLEVELLLRQTRQVKLTVQGQLLFEYAKKIIQLSGQAEVAIRAAAAPVLTGFLRIGTLNSLGMSVVSPLVGGLLKHNSSLRLKLEYQSSDKLLESFAQKELDVLILPDVEREFDRPLKSANTNFLFRDEMILVGSGRDSNLPRQISFSDLTSRPLVVSAERIPRFDLTLSKLLEKHKLKLDPVFESNNFGTLKRVVESGLGWGFLPTHAIHKQLRSGRLSAIQIDRFSYSMDVFIYSSKEKSLQPAIEAFQMAMGKIVESFL